MKKGTQSPTLPSTKKGTKADTGTIVTIPNTQKTVEGSQNNNKTKEGETIKIEEGTIENTEELTNNENDTNENENENNDNTLQITAQNADDENLHTLVAVTQSLRTLPGAFRVEGPNPYYSQTGNSSPLPPPDDEGAQPPGREQQPHNNIALLETDTDEEVCHVPSAYLVQEEDDEENGATRPELEIAEAEKVKPYLQRKEGQLTIIIVFGLMACLVILLGIFLSREGNSSRNDEASSTNELQVTPLPTAAPTLDPRPTLTIVRERGVVNCGIEDVNREGGVNLGEYNIDQCRALAATVFGDITKINLVIMGADDRYERLANHEVDVLYAGDTLTIEKLIREPTTGKAFAFGYPYYTAAVIYLGLETYVKCANDQKRYDECQDLAICAVDTPEIRSLITSFFPASFITFGTFPEMESSLKNETSGCNVLVSDTYRIYGSNAGLQDDINNGKYVISDYHISRNLLSSVVRWGENNADDGAWYDIVEASKHSVWRATQIGISRDESMCPMNSKSTENEVSFFNAPYCLGTSMEAFQNHLGSMVLSWGETTFFPSIDAPNFGSLECADCEDVLKDGRLKQIRERGFINCAVYLDPARNLTMTSLPTLVSAQFCKIMGVIIFQGKSDATNITYIDEMDYSAFPKEYDIVAGASWEARVGFNTNNLGTMSMSLPYYTHDKHLYNGTMYDGVGESISFALDSVEEALMRIALTVLTATVYAQRNGISRATYFDMPLMHLLGDSLTFILRDVILYAGNYDDIMNEAFASSDGKTEIGWNTVVQNYGLSPKNPVFYCDYTASCPPCDWIVVEGFSVCVSMLP